MKLSILAAAAALLSSSAVADAAAAPQAPVTIGQSHAIASRVLNQERRIAVYLPAGYEASGAAYPVLYLIDGGVGQDFHPITGVARTGELVDLNRPFIVVGVETVDRRAELTRPSSDAGEQRDFPTHGKAEAFRRYLTEEVKPWVAARYRVTGESAVMAESLGGLFVIDTLLTAPQAFTHYIAVSPSLWWDGERLSKSADAALSRPIPAGRTLYLSAADEGGGMQAGVERIVAALKARAPADLKWRYDPMPGETHATVYLPAAAHALRWTFAKPGER